MTIRGPIKIHGGKFYVSQWVIDHFPNDYEQLDFVEPYVGGGSVFLNKKKSVGVEAINDLDTGIIQIYRALRDEPTHFIGRLKRIKYCENTFKRMLHKETDNYMEQAIKEFVLRRMSRGGLKKSFAWSDRTRGGQPGDVNAWETIIEQLPHISKRLKDVYIFNKQGLEVIKAFDEEKMLLYVDPPYLPETRVSLQAYEHEMSIDDHAALAERLNRFRGKVLISGYMSQLYKRLYSEWKCHKKSVANHSSQVKKKEIRVECLWANF